MQLLNVEVCLMFQVKGHCHDNIIPTFTAIASFFHDRPIDAGIYAGCNPNSEINVSCITNFNKMKKQQIPHSLNISKIQKKTW